MKDMLFTYLIHLSTNMWNDRDSLVYKNFTEEQKDEVLEDLQVEWDKWDELIAFLSKNGFNTLLIDVGDAVVYERHPELAIRGSLTKDEFAKILEKIRTAGLTPIPKLNFSACHDAWLKKYSLMIGTSEYYKVCIDCLEEVAEMFDYPEYFHLGLDEECFKHQRNFGVATIRSPEVFWRDAYKLFNKCEQLGMQPWVWSDAYWHHPDTFLKYMPKSVLQSNWFYEAYRGTDKDGKCIQFAMQAYIDLDRFGYEQVPTGSTWTHERNFHDTMMFSKENLNPKLLKGIMAAPWKFCTGNDWYILMQEAVRFGLAKEKFFKQGR